MKPGGEWSPKWKRSYVRRAVRLRRALTNKELAKRLDMTIGAVNSLSKSTK